MYKEGEKEEKIELARPSARGDNFTSMMCYYYLEVVGTTTPHRRALD